MGGCLIFAREIQINIRNLIAFKAQKGFKRDGQTVLFHHGSAIGAHLVRHIHTNGIFAVFKEFAVFTAGTNIVGAEGVYLCDP